MFTNCYVLKYGSSDRTLFIFTDDNDCGGDIVGINFHQGIDEIDPKFMTPDKDLTKYIVKRLTKDGLPMYWFNENHDEWVDTIDEYISDWFDKRNEPKVVDMPDQIVEDVIKELEASCEEFSCHISDMSEEQMDAHHNVRRFIQMARKGLIKVDINQNIFTQLLNEKFA